MPVARPPAFRPRSVIRPARVSQVPSVNSCVNIPRVGIWKMDTNATGTANTIADTRVRAQTSNSAHVFLYGSLYPPYGYEAGYSVSSFSGPDSCSTLTILTQSPCQDICTHGHSARGSATCASIISPPSMLKRKELFRAIGEATIW